MKLYIIGYHCSGKEEIAKCLGEIGVKVGRVFSNLPPETPASVYNEGRIYYDNTEIHRIFENKTFKFLLENNDYPRPFYEGLTSYEVNNNDVFLLDPIQFSAIPVFEEDSVFIWLDNDYQNRKSRYHMERRRYEFAIQEAHEKECGDDFVSKLYNTGSVPVLYFLNEDPPRVAAIAYSLLQYPELLPVYKNSFV